MSRAGEMAIFVEADGHVHMVNPILGGEFTLCGDAFDLASHHSGYQWRETAKRTVTCQHCATVIFTCRGVRAHRLSETQK